MFLMLCVGSFVVVLTFAVSHQNRKCFQQEEALEARGMDGKPATDFGELQVATPMPTPTPAPTPAPAPAPAPQRQVSDPSEVESTTKHKQTAHGTHPSWKRGDRAPAALPDPEKPRRTCDA